MPSVVQPNKARIYGPDCVVQKFAKHGDAIAEGKTHAPKKKIPL